MQDMKRIPGGRFLMGSDEHYAEEAPAHPVVVDPFWIDHRPVTNEQFATFVEKTGYRTLAERPLDPAAFPGAPAENLMPGSLVFTRTAGPVDLRHLSQWWTWTPGASWRHPEGPRSTLQGRERHPVVHIAAQDAEAYALWAGKVLPTEAEWELAARGGREGARFVWGDEPERDGQRLANYWHGDFPWRPTPGYGHTTPVGCFPANGFGLYDVAGNVWEWTTNWYAARHPEPADKLVPMRRLLLHALPAGSATAAAGGHRHEPHRLPLRAAKRMRRRPLACTCQTKENARDPAARPLQPTHQRLDSPGDAGIS